MIHSVHSAGAQMLAINQTLHHAQQHSASKQYQLLKQKCC